MEFVKLFKKYIQPFIAIGILIMLMFIVGMLIADRELKHEINENCGWGEEDYYCYCEKSEAVAIRNLLNQSFDFDSLDLENAGLVG